MDLRHLRYFLEIVDRGSMSRAAETLNVAQPSLSFHVRNMEAELGVSLLLRTVKGVSPTEAGSLLAARARRILDDAAKTMDDVRNLDRSPGGIVRIGLPGTISEIISLPLIERLSQTYPRITLNVSEAMSGFVADWLTDGRIDIAVLYHGATEPAGQTELLVEEELTIISGMDQTDLPSRDLAGLGAVPLVLPSKGHGLRDLVDRTARSVGIDMRVKMEIDSYKAIKQLVAAGYGASVLPRHAVEQEVSDGILRQHRFNAPGLWRGAYLVSKNEVSLGHATRAVEAEIRKLTADLVAAGAWVGARTA